MRVAILRKRIILQTAQYFLSEGQTIGVICFSDADFDDDNDDKHDDNDCLNYVLNVFSFCL